MPEYNDCSQLRTLQISFDQRSNNAYLDQRLSNLRNLRHLVTTTDMINIPEALAIFAHLPNLTNLSLYGYSIRQQTISTVLLPDTAFPSLISLQVECWFPVVVESLWRIVALVGRLTCVQVNLPNDEHPPRVTPVSALRAICANSPNLHEAIMADAFTSAAHFLNFSNLFRFAASH
jgi:hypothetical protein